MLLIDDQENEWKRVRDALQTVGVETEWARSYTEARERLRELSRLFDAVLVDQVFSAENVRDEDLLGPRDVAELASTATLDPREHQGLFILRRLLLDIAEGTLRDIPSMMLTGHPDETAALDVGALRVRYGRKRDVLADPYRTLRGMVSGLTPPGDVVSNHVPDAVAADEQLLELVNRAIDEGLALEAIGEALSNLDPPEYGAVVQAIQHLRERDGTPPGADVVAKKLEGRRLRGTPPVHIHGLWPLGRVDHLELFRLQVQPADGAAAAFGLLAIAVLPASGGPSDQALQHYGRFREVGRVVRERLDQRWMAIGAWEPVDDDEDRQVGQRATLQHLASITDQLATLHDQQGVHGLVRAQMIYGNQLLLAGLPLLALGTAEPEELGAELDALKIEDRVRLIDYGMAAFGGGPPAAIAYTLDSWKTAVDGGRLSHAARILRASAQNIDNPPVFWDYDPSGYPSSSGERAFRDMLLNALGPDDHVLREVSWFGTGTPLDFVVCTRDAIVGIEHKRHRGGRARVTLDRRTITVTNGSYALEKAALNTAHRRYQRACKEIRSTAARRLGRDKTDLQIRWTIAVAGNVTIDGPGPERGWPQVMTEQDVLDGLHQLGEAGGTHTGRQLAEAVFDAPAGERGSVFGPRLGRWQRRSRDNDMARLVATRSSYRQEAWQSLVKHVRDAAKLLNSTEVLRDACPLQNARGITTAGNNTRLDPANDQLERVECDLELRAEALPLSRSVGALDAATSYTVAAALIRTLRAWESCEVGYDDLTPAGVLIEEAAPRFDLIDAVRELDPSLRIKQRRGLAACLVALLAPAPHTWPSVLDGTLTDPPESGGSTLAWTIGMDAIQLLLGDGLEPIGDDLAMVADQLAAAAVLADRLPLRGEPDEASKPLHDIASWPLVTVDADRPPELLPRDADAKAYSETEVAQLCVQQPSHLAAWAPQATFLRSQAVMAIVGRAGQAVLITDAFPDLRAVSHDVKVLFLDVDDPTATVQESDGHGQFELVQVRNADLFDALQAPEAAAHLLPLLDVHASLLDEHRRAFVQEHREVLEASLVHGDALPDEVSAAVADIAGHAALWSRLRLEFHELSPDKSAAAWQAAASRIAATLDDAAAATVRMWIGEDGDWEDMRPEAASDRRGITARLLWHILNEPDVNDEDVLQVVLG